MQSDIRSLLYKAEENYLNSQEMELFKTHIASLGQRLEVYELLRDREVEIFQPVADELCRLYPQETPLLIEKALKHWLAIMRYCSMAMLLNNPEYLQRGILEWLTEIVHAHQMQSLETTIYNLLSSELQKILSQDRFALIRPFLEQSQAILGDRVVDTVGERK